MLGDRIRLSAAITQWANVAGLIAALYRQDWDLLQRSLVDVVAEPVRAPTVPGFEAVREAALEAGAVGCGLSGSGPAIFALCCGRQKAKEIADAMTTTYDTRVGIDTETFVSSVGARGAHLV